MTVHATPGTSGLTRAGAVPLLRMAGVVLGLHLLGGTLLLTAVSRAVTPHGVAPIFGVSIGVTAYVLGMRHAFDVDHIAAIDSTTRKLLGDGIRSRSVGFWFSLGHSSIVLLVCVALAAGARLVGTLVAPGGGLRDILALLGTTVSGVFLCGLGILNLGNLSKLLPHLRRAGEGAAVQSGALPGGVLARVLRPVTRAITRPWQMFLVGLLFGLGFDTASEVALLVVAGGAAMAAVPWYAVLSLPILFAAGMSLLDSLDGWLMSVAYGWTFAHPRRQLLYSSVLTALSAGIALAIGTIQLASLATTGGGTGVHFGALGYGVVGLFVVVWLAAVLAGRSRAARRASGPDAF